MRGFSIHTVIKYSREGSAIHKSLNLFSIDSPEKVANCGEDKEEAGILIVGPFLTLETDSTLQTASGIVIIVVFLSCKRSARFGLKDV